MKNIALKITVACFAIGLTACSSFTSQQASESSMTQANAMQANPAMATPGAPVKADATIVGSNANVPMDSIDKSKMSRALDKPLGKATHWTNVTTGVTYTVTPVKKLSVNGNQFCRQYTTLIERGEKSRQVTGTACVTPTGSWQDV